MFNRNSIFLIIHAVILAAIFSSRFLGVNTDYILIAITAVMSMEAIYIALFTKSVVNKTSGSLKEMEKEMLQAREDAYTASKLQRALIYTSHQIKTIQGDLDLLKKRSGFKSNGNNSHSGPLIH